MYTKKITDDDEVDVILAHYLAKRIGEIKPGTDIREWKWIGLKNLTKEKLAPNVLPALRYFGFVK